MRVYFLYKMYKKIIRIADDRVFYIANLAGSDMLCSNNKNPLKNLSDVRDFKNRFKESKWES